MTNLTSTTLKLTSNRTSMMHCPQCNQRVLEVLNPKNKAEKAYYCPECSWGKDRALQLQEGISPPPQETSPTSHYIIVPSFVRITLSLAISAILLAIPYTLFVTLWPFSDALPGPFHVAYWLLVAIYLAAAYFEDPRIYQDWDVWAFDNPFKLNDETNQTSTILTIFLIPGKLLVWSLSALIGRIFG